ncbi:MAG: hypothetical protein KatS3mg108_0430 [Isosphaeraceae bacterium]|jgi:hypothetical protein|nr:MAG: hypothetical protein KatS3mg108_0430 [Isosphaeraceae bacterium]
MRRALAVLLAAVVPALRADEIPLFNGRNLDGWTAVLDKPDADPAQTWSVADGVLRCTGRPIGYIRTNKDDYHDYVLTLEWRWPEGSQGGNNGVLVHTSTPNALGIWPKSIEVQLASGDAGDFWVIGTELDVPNEETRKRDRRHINLTDGSEKPIGQWNTMEITCKGDTIRVRINGELVNEASGCSVTRGAICLQSEGAPIEFRNIVLRPIE